MPYGKNTSGKMNSSMGSAPKGASKVKAGAMPQESSTKNGAPANTIVK